jgi:hypothetical protein
MGSDGKPHTLNDAAFVNRTYLVVADVLRIRERADSTGK